MGERSSNDELKQAMDRVHAMQPKGERIWWFYVDGETHATYDDPAVYKYARTFCGQDRKMVRATDQEPAGYCAQCMAVRQRTPNMEG